MASSRIVVHGCYNTPNFGDLLLLDLAAGHVERRFGVRPSVPWPLLGSRNDLMASAGNGLATCIKADAAIFGGGGYLADRGTVASARRLLRYTIPARLWRALRTPYVIVGVGVGPLLSERGAKRVIPMCRGAMRVCVRDEDSRQLLIDAGLDPGRVEAAADMVLALRPDDIPEKSRHRAEQLLGPRVPGRRRLGVHLQLLGEHEPVLRQLVEQALASLKGRDNVELIWLADHDDTYYESARRFGAEELPNGRFLPKQDHWTTAALIGGMDGVITTKLHVGITAWALGVAPCGYSIHPKTRRLYRQIGRSDFQCDLGAPMAQVDGWLRLFADDFTAFAAECPTARRQLPTLARRNYAIIDELVRTVVPAHSAAV